MRSGTRRTFTPEFKIEAAHQVIDGGAAVAFVARQLEIKPSLLSTWVSNERARMAADGETADEEPEQPDAEAPAGEQAQAEGVPGVLELRHEALGTTRAYVETNAAAELAALRERNAEQAHELTGRRQDEHDMLAEIAALRTRNDEQARELAVLTAAREADHAELVALRNQNAAQAGEVEFLREGVRHGYFATLGLTNSRVAVRT